MALKGKSFSIDSGAIDNVLARITKERVRANSLVVKKITAATNIIYRIARARRPMITKTMMKQMGRTSRVSDPSAEAGVPVASGNLQLSIKKDVKVNGDKVTGTVTAGGQGAGYAAYVEFGTSKMAARPFMRPAIALSRPAIKQMFNKQEDA